MDIVSGLHEGHCLELLKRVPDGYVNMVLADLPYQVTRNAWDQIIPMDKLWSEFDRVCVPNAVIALTASQPFTSYLVMSNPERFRHEWIWLKNRGSNFANTVREPFKEHESVLIFSRGKWTYNPQMQERTGGGADRVKYDFTFTTETDNFGAFEGKKDVKLPDMRVPSSWQKFNTEVGLHPTQKPVDLFRYLIRTYTNPGDVVLDPCVGSGTTAVAAMAEKRSWIAFEKDPKYVQVAQKRIDDQRAEQDPFWFLPK
jgi:site-specific DNA-methyltransferase (adenine-specific)